MTSAPGSGESIPGSGARPTGAAAPSSIPYDGTDPVEPGGLPVAARRELAAAEGESRTSLRLGVLLAVPVVVLVLLALLNAVGWLQATPVAGEPHALGRSLLVLVLLLVASQLVSALLALEHLAAGPGRATDDLDPVLVVWVARLLILGVVVLAVAVGVLPISAWWTVTWSAALAEVGALVVLAVVVALAARRTNDAGDAGDPADLRPPTPAGAADVRWHGTGDRILAIGASGGGIRAAAFVLGGHQAVQDVRVEEAGPGGTPEAEEPHVFAVSGGSYVASALALRRTYAGDGEPRETPTPWSSTYAMGSPELERLRRHTRYLFEPAWRTRDGLVSLLMGAAVHLAIVGTTLRFVTWLSGQLALTTGLVEMRRTRTSEGYEASALALTGDWSWQVWLVVLGVPAACLLGAIGLTMAGWTSTSVFNSRAVNEDAMVRRRAVAKVRMDGSARLRPTLLAAGLVWLLLVLGLPAATVGVVDLATSNRPTTTAAAALNGLGFGTPALCTQSFVARVQAAVVRTNTEGRISPDVAHEQSAGACGLETTVSRTVDSQGDADPRNDVAIPGDVGAARLLADQHLLAFQVAGIGALLALVIGLLRRGPSPEASAASGRLTRVRRVLMTWLPLLITALVALYLALWWTFGFLTRLGAAYTVTGAAVSVAACVLAYLVDANATSMHRFYRSRLSDAFAVGVDDATGRAEELPMEKVYRFSEMARASCPSPRLHVVTTLNSLAPNETPTMRGGFPLVFGPEHVKLYREEARSALVPTRDYEDFAGPGRVSVMASVAISGAAISPLMGRFAVQAAPYRLLLALFNLRLGTWVRNPLHTHDTTAERGFWRPSLWMTRKPGLAQVLLEAVGRASADRRWIYLSDGGHLDNTGLVECVRHAVEQRVRGRIVVLDASNDPVDTWSAVGDAIAVVRADLGLELRRTPLEDEPPWMRRYAGPGLAVVVVKAVRAEPAGATAGTAGGTDWWSLLPPNVQSFQLVNKDFPRASTARQKFGDLEFEAYRSLGYAATRSSLAAAAAHRD